jgi:hypothetical protein
MARRFDVYVCVCVGVCVCVCAVDLLDSLFQYADEGYADD